MNVALVNLPEACQRSAWRQRLVTAASNATPVNLTTFSISALSQNLGVATATAAAAHGLLPGDSVTIAGASPAGYNVRVKVDTVPTATTFTFAVDASLAQVATGTITAKADLWYRRAFFRPLKAARTANTGIVYLGLDPTNDTQPIAIANNGSLDLEAATAARLNLADLWLDVATNADGVLVWFH